MRTVFKFSVPVDDIPTVHPMPSESKILHTAPAGESDVVFWAEVNTANETEHREFFIAGTGHPISGNCVHVGTAVTINAMVWHLYETI